MWSLRPLGVAGVVLLASYVDGGVFHILIYIGVWLLLALCIEHVAHEWRRKLRLKGKIAAPPGKEFVPAGNLLVRIKNVRPPEDGRPYQIIGLFKEGELYDPNDPYFPLAEMLENGQSLPFRGRLRGGYFNVLESATILNNRGKPVILPH